jgi:hypothetical protein
MVDRVLDSDARALALRRRETSRQGLERELTFPDGLCGIAKRFSDIGALEVGIGSHYLVVRHTVRDHGDDRGHRDTKAPDAGSSRR